MSALAGIGAIGRPRGWIVHGLVPALAAAALGLMVAEQPLAGIALCLGLALALAVVARPDILTVLLVFLLYVNAPGVAVKSHGAPVVVGLVTILLLLVPLAYHVSRGRGLVFTPAFVLLLLLFTVYLASTAFALDIDRSWLEVQTFMIEAALLYFLVSNVIRTPETLRHVLWAVVLGGAFLAAISIFQDVTATHSKDYGGFALVPVEFFSGHAVEPRLAGPIGDPNYYAQLLLISVPIGMFMIWTERSRLLRFVALGAVVCAVYGILLTNSRGAGIAFIFVFLLTAFLRAIRPRYVILVIVGLVIALSAVPTYRDRITTVTAVGSATDESGSDSAADESVRSRTTEMLAAAYVFADHPYVGVGPGNFPLYYQEYAEQIGIELREEVKFGPRRGEAPQRESHNMFLSVAADLGLVGVLSFAGIIVLTLRELLRARRRWLGTRPDLASLATSVLLAVIAYVMTGFFLTLAYERYFWILLGIAGAAGFVLNREAAGSPLETARTQRRA